MDEPDSEEGGPRGRARSETLAIPGDIRAAVDARDGLHCRVCGKYMGDGRAQHHIEYGGGFGVRRQHSVDNLITVCWMWGGNCHDRVHSNKGLWVPLLQQVIRSPGMTGLQLLRWQRARR